MNSPHTYPNDHESPPEDVVDVLSMSPPQQGAGHDLGRNHGDQHGSHSDATGANSVSGEGQVISRFKFDTPGLENHFKFLPAPRHAPGHFTNRMIIPRVDGSEQQNTPPPFQASRPAPHVPFIASPLSAAQTVGGPVEQRTPRKKLTLPVADQQVQAAHGVEMRISPTDSLPQPPRPVGAGHTQGHSSGPVSGMSQVPVTDREHALVQSSESGQHMSSRLSRKRSADGQPVPLPIGRPPHTVEHANEPKSVQNRPNHLDAIVPAAPGHKNIVPQSHSQYIVDTLPRANVPRQHVDNMENQGPMQARHNYQHQQTTCGTTDAARNRNRSLSLSGSSSGSGVAKIARASMRNLNKYRERDLPEVANKVNDLWMLCNTAVKDAEKESQHTVEKYRKKLHDRSQRIRRYLETIDVQTHAIQSLEADKQDLTNRVTRLETELRDCSDLVPKLRDKCRGMQETVDSALKEHLEQRQLHSQYRKSTHEAIGELRAEKQREQASREIVESQLAAVREQMKEKVCQVEMLSKEECRRSKCSITPGVSGDCHG